MNLHEISCLKETVKCDLQKWPRSDGNSTGSLLYFLPGGRLLSDAIALAEYVVLHKACMDAPEDKRLRACRSVLKRRVRYILGINPPLPKLLKRGPQDYYMISLEHRLAVKERIDIAAYIDKDTPLRKIGKELVGLCPFHDEKTPSFNVNPEKQMFFCRGCQTGGDIFTYVMLKERCIFPEAYGMLEKIAGIA